MAFYTWGVSNDAEPMPLEQCQLWLHILIYDFQPDLIARRA